MMALDFVAANSEWVDLATGTLSALQNVAGGTVMAWVVPDVTTGTCSMVSFSTGVSAFISRLAIERNLATWRGVATPTDGVGGVFLSTGSIVSTGVQVHVAAVADFTGSSFDVYVNGVSLANSSPAWGSNTSNTASSNASIGAQDDGSGNFCDGRLDDVRVYNRALSSVEMEIIAAARGRDSVLDGLVHRWKLVEAAPGVGASGAGSVLDSPIGFINGTPTNTPTYFEDLVSSRRRRAA